MTRATAAPCRRRIPALLLAAALLASGCPAAAGQAGPVENDALAASERADGITVKVTRGSAGLEIEGRCTVAAPAAVVWAVLTDYDSIDRFVSSMRESRVSARTDHHVVVEQVAIGRVLLFTRRLRATLSVEEIPPDRIRFEDVLGRDFESYRGEWRIEQRAQGVEIIYLVGARPSFSVPDFLARRLFRRTARELLGQVRTEIERRAAMEERRGEGEPHEGGEQPGS